jgi:hypothetical protein
MVVAKSGGGFVEAQWDCENAMMGFGVGNAEVDVIGLCESELDVTVPK